MRDVKPYYVVRLESDTEIGSFKCTDEDLNDFLLTEAKNYQKELLAVTYLVLDPDTDNIVAYYSLLNDQVRFTTENKKARNSINRHIPHSKQRTHYPAMKIGRLAVDQRYAHKGIGQFVIKLIMSTLAQRFPSGCRVLTVDAYADAVIFYERCGFRFFTETDAGEDTRLMYYDLRNFR